MPQATTNATHLRIVSDNAPDAADVFAALVLQTLMDGAQSQHTRDAFRRDLNDFAEFYANDALTPGVVGRIISLDGAGIIQALTAYKAWSRKRGLTPATINRRLASIRGLLRVGSRLGAACPDPRGLVRDEKGATAYRDTEGPPIEDVVRLLSAQNLSTTKGKRDFALLLLYVTNALRRNEALACDVGDFNAKRSRLRIIGKGQGGQKQSVSLDADTTAAIVDYLDARPDVLRPDSPLFASCDRLAIKQGEGKRLGGRGWAKAVAGMGERVLGERLHSHAFRHTAATAALVATNGDVPRVQALTRHAKTDTLMLYFHRMRDDQGETTRLLAGLVRAAREKQ